MKVRGIGTACLGLALALIGCAGTRHPESTLPDAPESVSGYSALCAARWKGPDRAGRARIALAFLPPDRIRVEVLDPAGNSQALLVATGQGALVLTPPRRGYRAFPTGIAASSALIGIAAPPQVIARLLLGLPSMLASGRCQSDTASREEEPLRCALPEGGVLILQGHHQERGALSFADGARLELRWDTGSTGESSLPRWLEIRQAVPEAVLRLETREIGFARPNPDLFSLQVPEGFNPDSPGGRP